MMNEFSDQTTLFALLCSWDNLLRAYRKAAKGKRGRIPAASFEYRLEDNLLDIQEDLVNGRYVPGAYRSFYVHEPKRRLISAAPFRDRVVHHALCNVIEPIFERSFIEDSFSNRMGKGTQAFRSLRREEKTMEEMPLFVRTHDFVAWLLPASNRFPRSQRFLVTKRLLDAALDFLETIVQANNRRGVERLSKLREAGEILDSVRFYLRLAVRWNWLTPGQYGHSANMVAEIGRLLGGWQKATRGFRA